MPAKREAILAAATAVFLREGYARASVDTIAAKADVSKRTVYSHFADKEALFLAVVNTAHNELFGTASVDIADLLCRPDRVDHDIRLIGRRVLDYLLEPEVAALRRLIIAEVAHHPGIGAACRHGVPHQIAQWMAGRLGELAAAGALSVDDPVRAAHQFMSLLVANGLSESLYGTSALDETQAAAIVDDAADIFLRAYRRR